MTVEEAPAVQLELDVDQDEGLGWDDWFRSLPMTPGSETTVGQRLDVSEEPASP